MNENEIEQHLIDAAIDQAAGLELTNAKVKLIDAEDRNRRYVSRIEALEAKLASAAEWLTDTASGWSGSQADFEAYYEGLAEILDVDLTQEIEVTVTMSQQVTIKVPIGLDYELTAMDFWFRTGTELLDSNYEIVNEQSAEVDDLSTY